MALSTQTLSLPLSHSSLSHTHAGHLNTLALSTQTIHKCRIKKETIKRAQFETEIEGQDARSRQKNRGSRCLIKAKEKFKTRTKNWGLVWVSGIEESWQIDSISKEEQDRAKMSLCDGGLY